MRRTAPLAAFSAAVLLACVPRAASSGAVDPIGCWYFERDADAVELALPWGVRLTRDELVDWPGVAARGGLRAATLSPDGDQDFPFGYWIGTADSVEIGYPGGRGLVLELHATDTSMAGTARAVGDALPPDGQAPATHAVRLLRAACPEG